MNNFVGYEPTKKEKIAGILWAVALILFMVYIAKNNPNPQFVCDQKCRVFGFVIILSTAIIGMIISLIIFQAFGGEIK
jgi:hypothetical protein